MNSDLISRSALKEEIEKSETPEGYKLYAIRLIDNAPTVEALKDITELHCDITKEQLLNALRPQGEWVAREDMDFLDENKVVHNHFQCDQCGLIHDFIDGHTSQYNFCPQCGAKMKGGAE